MPAGTSIQPYITTYVKFYTFDAVNTAINTIPNLPPILKIIATAGIQAAKTREIINFVRKSDLPGPAKTLAVAVGSIGAIQSSMALIPTLMGAMQGQQGFLGQAPNQWGP